MNPTDRTQPPARTGVDAETPSVDNRDMNFDDPRVATAVQEFLSALESGQRPSRQQLLDRYPDIAAELAQCLDGLELVHEAAAGMRPQPAAQPLTGLNPAGPDAPLPLGDFSLVREIGRGGMGIVYEAIQLSLGRRVAVKVLPFAAALDPQHLQRFKNEAQAAAQLHHSNIVPVYAVGSQRGVHYYAMQLIDGQPLSVIIQQLREREGKTKSDSRSSALGSTTFQPRSVSRSSSGARSLWPDDPTISMPSLTPAPSAQPSGAGSVSGLASTVLAAHDRTRADHFRSVAGLIRQAAVALAHAHEFGIVHRDIKPANLLIDGRGNLWVTDFGLALIQQDMNLTRTGDVVGTLRYMSPEQAAGDRLVLDHRTDIYSLGVTLYELLTLEPIFGEGDRNGLMRRILEDEPAAPRTIERSVPIDLETIVLKSISKAPIDRYATAQDFAADLQRFLDDQPVMARRPGLVDQGRKWARRHRTVVRSAAVFAFLATLGLLASTILIAREHSKTVAAYEREIEQREAAEESFRQARQAVDTFTQLGEEELADNPGMYQLRRKFLAAALQYYNNFLNQRHDDPSLQAELAATSQRVANIIEDLAVLEGYGPLVLLYAREVQDDLAITAGQRKELEPLLAQLTAERRQARTGGRRQQVQVRQQQLAEALRSIEQQIAGVLSATQFERLRQIAWQQRGPFAFKSPDIVAALKLTPEQRQRITQIIEEERPSGKGPGGPPHGEPRSPPDDGFANRFDQGRGPPNFDDKGGPPPKPGDDRRGPPRNRPDDFTSIGEDGPPPPKPPDMDDDNGPGGPRGGRRHGEWSRNHGPHDGHPMSAVMARTTARILLILSPDQLAAWQKLIGKPIAYDLHFAPDEWLPR
jgi:serine/threonine protein kinase